MSSKRSTIPLLFTFTILGLSGIVAQVVLLRELLILFLGNELSIGIILANWLVLEAAGALVLGHRIELITRRIEAYTILSLISSLGLPVSIFLTRTITNLVGTGFVEGSGLLQMSSLSFLILLPVSITHGALFTSGCKVFAEWSGREEKATGKVYIYEILGTTIGGALVTFALFPYFHSFHIAFVIILLNCVILPLLLIYKSRRSLYTMVLFSLTLAITIGTTLLFVYNLPDKIHKQSLKLQWQDQKVLFSKNSQYGNITVTKHEEQYNFFSNGIPVIATPTPDTESVESFVHFPMLIHPNPRKVLVLSGGAGGIINEILKHPVDKIDYIELDPLILEALDSFPTPITTEELHSRRVSITNMDGRLFLKQTQLAYDVIFVGLDNPSDLQTNRLFTREFFSLAKKRLNQEGIIVISAPGSLSYLNEEMKKLNRSILNALTSVYASLYIIPGDTNIFIASHQDMLSSASQEDILGRFEERHIETSLFTSFYIEYRLHERWKQWFNDSISRTDVEMNLDFKPKAVFYSLSLWHSMYSPRIGDFFSKFENLNITTLGLASGILIFIFFLTHLIWSGFSSRIAVPLSIATTGFAGMIFDLVLIFCFQVLYGYVYSIIGLLIASFMAGSGAGGVAITISIDRIKKGLRLFFLLELALVLFAASLPLLFFKFIPTAEMASSSVEAFFFTLCFLGGCIVGAQFPLANKLILGKTRSVGKTAGVLYASDLIGGFIGGMIGGALLLPVLGLTWVCFVVIVFKSASLSVLGLSARKIHNIVRY
ncbi:MAG: spermine synthase [Spirochaetota bacterium]|nr:MAG: spermine synthase [Spirochaetota bacterium]